MILPAAQAVPVRSSLPGHEHGNLYVFHGLCLFADHGCLAQVLEMTQG